MAHRRQPCGQTGLVQMQLLLMQHPFACAALTSLHCNHVTRIYIKSTTAHGSQTAISRLSGLTSQPDLQKDRLGHGSFSLWLGLSDCDQHHRRHTPKHHLAMGVLCRFVAKPVARNKEPGPSRDEHQRGQQRQGSASRVGWQCETTFGTCPRSRLPCP